jgi:hypothetical protein
MTVRRDKEKPTIYFIEFFTTGLGGCPYEDLTRIRSDPHSSPQSARRRATMMKAEWATIR